MRLIDDHDGPDYNRGAHGGKDAQENGDGPFVCEVIGDFDLEGVVMVVCYHERRACRIEGQVENRHNDGREEVQLIELGEVLGEREKRSIDFEIN